MGNKIALLPDNVANQIAAGEVVQRPASAVKELIENALDAGATQIHLNVKEAGKTLIQLIDNGEGMSETDVRMAFERHATSKIKSAEDLFNLTTKGFRGEALASIAAVAQVECKTKRQEDEVATILKIEGNKVLSQDYTSGVNGTTISVKNLFFNIPARRNFLKSNQVEFKHIIDEFERVALAHPNVGFKLTHNANEVFNLPESNLRQRILGVFGKKFNERLVPVEEFTDVVGLTGFIVKPQFAKRTRGEQFFFVNNRFIKSSFLHKAIVNAFEGLLSPDQFPSYFVFMDINPARIDVNIHPTKTEIKFDDEPSIFAILRSTIKKSLGQFNVAPSLDFNHDQQFSVPPLPKGQTIKAPHVVVDTSYNPFKEESVMRTAQLRANGNSLPQQNWESAFENTEPEPENHQFEVEHQEEAEETKTSAPLLLHKQFILFQTKSGIMMVHLKRALERIYYEEFLAQFSSHSTAVQQLLFPVNMDIKQGDLSIFHEILPDLAQLGFDLDIQDQTLTIHGIPLQITESEVIPTLELLLESAKSENRELELEKHKAMARQLAYQAAQNNNKLQSTEAQMALIDQLFACQNPSLSLQGKPTVAQVSLNDLEKYFN